VINRGNDSFWDGEWGEAEMAAAADQTSQYEVIAKLWQYGHLRRPDRPNNIRVEDLPKLTLCSPDVREGLDSFLQFNGYELRADATGGLDRLAIGAVMQPRCGCNDFEGVGELESSADELAATSGSGSWPANCDPAFPGRHTFAVQFDFRGMPSYLGSPEDPSSPFSQAWGLCRAAYADMGLAMLVKKAAANCQAIFTWKH
jgi:hypothetical protein